MCLLSALFTEVAINLQNSGGKWHTASLANPRVSLALDEAAIQRLTRLFSSWALLAGAPIATALDAGSAPTSSLTDLAAQMAVFGFAGLSLRNDGVVLRRFLDLWLLQLCEHVAPRRSALRYLQGQAPRRRRHTHARVSL